MLKPLLTLLILFLIVMLTVLIILSVLPSTNGPLIKKIVNGLMNLLLLIIPKLLLMTMKIKFQIIPMFLFMIVYLTLTPIVMMEVLVDGWILSNGLLPNLLSLEVLTLKDGLLKKLPMMTMNLFSNTPIDSLSISYTLDKSNTLINSIPPLSQKEEPVPPNLYLSPKPQSKEPVVKTNQMLFLTSLSVLKLILIALLPLSLKSKETKNSLFYTTQTIMMLTPLFQEEVTSYTLMKLPLDPSPPSGTFPDYGMNSMLTKLTLLEEMLKVFLLLSNLMLLSLLLSLLKENFTTYLLILPNTDPILFSPYQVDIKIPPILMNVQKKSMELQLTLVLSVEEEFYNLTNKDKVKCQLLLNPSLSLNPLNRITITPAMEDLTILITLLSLLLLSPQSLLLPSLESLEESTTAKPETTNNLIITLMLKTCNPNNKLDSNNLYIYQLVLIIIILLVNIYSLKIN